MYYISTEITRNHIGMLYWAHVTPYILALHVFAEVLPLLIRYTQKLRAKNKPTFANDISISYIKFTHFFIIFNICRNKLTQVTEHETFVISQPDEKYARLEGTYRILLYALWDEGAHL